MRRLLDRRLLLGAYAVYLLAVLYLTLSPQPDAPGGAVTRVTDALHGIGFGAVTDVHVEFGLNVVMTVPLGLLGMLLWPRVPWWAWAPIGLALSAFLEGWQWAFLPGRSPTVSDLVANSAGALVGAGVVALVRREARATTSGETRRPPVLSPSRLLGVAVVFVVAGAVLVLQPSANVAVSTVQWVSHRMWELGAPRWLAAPAVWERVLNVLLFVPLGVLAALVRPGWSLVRWAGVGFVCSLAIELVQAGFLTARDATVSDLLTNTLGAVLGAWLARRVAESSALNRAESAHLRR